MSEREPMDDFEQRLRVGARAYTQPASRPFDPLATARAAMLAPAPRWSRYRGPGRPFGRALVPAVGYGALLLLAVAGLVLAYAALALAPASTPLPAGPPRLVFVRDGDLFVSAIDGTGVTRISDGGADDTQTGYLMARWSPDMRHIAALRDLGGPGLTPVIELLAPDGTHEHSFEPGPGGTPSLSWSPDSRELAVTTYAAEVQRYVTEPVRAAVHLTVLGIDGSSRGVPLPADATWFASGDGAVWTDPDLWVRWSPDSRWIGTVLNAPASVTRGDRWHFVAADGSSTHPWSDLTAGRCRAPADNIDWFPDGRRLATVGKGFAGQELCVEELGSRSATAATPEPGTLETIVDDPASNLHGLMELPHVSPDGERIAISRFTDDFVGGTRLTVLRAYDVASGSVTDVASGTQVFSLDPTGAGQVTDTLDGTPVWGAGIAWSPDGRQLLYLSPEQSEGPPRWTVYAAAAAGGGRPSVVLQGVRSFDLGYPH